MLLLLAQCGVAGVELCGTNVFVLVCTLCFFMSCLIGCFLLWSARNTSFSWGLFSCYIYILTLLCLHMHSIAPKTSAVGCWLVAMLDVFVLNKRPRGGGGGLLLFHSVKCGKWAHMYVTVPSAVIYVSSSGRLVNEHGRRLGLFGKWAHCHQKNPPNALLLLHSHCHFLSLTHTPCPPPPPHPPAAAC